MVPVLETERLLLRGWEPTRDAAPFAALNADPEVMRHIGSGAPLSRDESAVLLARVLADWSEHGFGLWAVEERDAPGVLLGFCGLAVPSFLPQVLPAVEVGWRLRRDAWGKGLATEGARAALAFGFERRGMREILSVIHPDNARSRRVAEKLGMARAADRVRPDTGERLTVWVARAAA